MRGLQWVLLAIFSAAGAASAHHADRDEPYHGPGDVILLCDEPQERNVGGTCFSARPRELLHISIVDKVAPAVRATWRATGTNGATLAEVDFCSAIEAWLPAGTQRITVFVHATIDANCSVVPPTIGVISIEDE